MPARRAPERRKLPHWYLWLAGFFVLDATEAFGVIDRLIYGTWEGKGGDAITQCLALLLIVVSFVLFGYSCRTRNPGLAAGSTLTVLLVVFLFLSALWSTSPATTVRIAVVYLVVVVGVIGIARTMDADEYIHLVTTTCLLSAVASIALLIVSPGNAFMFGEDFIGIFPHKNFLGQVMATGVLATLHDLRVARRGYILKTVVLLIFLAMVVASKSTTALLAALVFCSISGYFALYGKGGMYRLSAVALLVLQVPIFAVAFFAPDVILEAIGKDPTLTGRTEIWAYVINDIWLRPLLGWGYFGFWQLTNPAALEISNAMHWVVPQAHNGVLELMLNVGLIGTSFFLALLARIAVLAYKCLDTPARALAISTLSVCIGIVLEGVSETVLLNPTESLTPILFITGLMCERALWSYKQPQRSALLLSRVPNRGHYG